MKSRRLPSAPHSAALRSNSWRCGHSTPLGQKTSSPHTPLKITPVVPLPAPSGHCRPRTDESAPIRSGLSPPVISDALSSRSRYSTSSTSLRFDRVLPPPAGGERKSPVSANFSPLLEFADILPLHAPIKFSPSSTDEFS